MQKRSVCVYCGSRDGKDCRLCTRPPRPLVPSLGAHKTGGLVYGAGDIGLMGACGPKLPKAAGGETFRGDSNTLDVQKKWAKTDLTELCCD